MKKRYLSRLILFAVVFSMVFALIACGGDDDADTTTASTTTTAAATTTDAGSSVSEGAATDDGGDIGDIDLSSGFKLDPVKFQGQTVSFMTGGPQENAGRKEEWDNKKYDFQHHRGWVKEYRTEFEDATGATVTQRPVPEGEGMATRYLAEIAAGVGPDVIIFWADSKPNYLLKNIVIGLNDYIDFDSPDYADDRYISRQITDYYRWKGQIYGVNKPFPTCLMWYNKEMVDQLGMSDPLDLWKQGRWTWDAWVELAMAMTQDLTGDGNMDTFGYAGWMYGTWQIPSNGVDFVTFDADGMPTFAMDHKWVTAKEFTDDMSQKYGIVPWDWWTDPFGRFYEGVIGMTYWLTNQLVEAKQTMGMDAVGFVCAPRGPDLPANMTSRDQPEALAFGVTGCSKNPELAALFLEWMMRDQNDTNDKKARFINEIYGSEEMYQYAQEWNGNAPILQTSGFGQDFADILAKIVPNADEGITYASALEANRGAAQTALYNFLISTQS
ncbi:MAG: hypothetical protein FWE70_01380 [Oscillospiraceae bacterium]|nr:hypothetical protein [Oscillospiraceae bacterium]